MCIVANEFRSSRGDLIQVDYIDLFLIHDPYSGTERRLATYKALQEAKQAGKIRDVGVSNLCVYIPYLFHSIIPVAAV